MTQQPRSGSESVTLRVPTDVLESIEVIAKGTERSRSFIIVRALKTYLLNEGADILAALNGRDQIEAGEHEDIDEVIADLEKMVTGRDVRYS